MMWYSFVMPATRRTYRGIVQNGIIVLKPPAALPEGTEVEVTELTPPVLPDWEVAKQYIGTIRSSDKTVDVSERVDELLTEAHFVSQDDAPQR